MVIAVFIHMVAVSGRGLEGFVSAGILISGNFVVLLPLPAAGRRL